MHRILLTLLLLIATGSSVAQAACADELGARHESAVAQEHDHEDASRPEGHADSHCCPAHCHQPVSLSSPLPLPGAILPIELSHFSAHSSYQDASLALLTRPPLAA